VRFGFFRYEADLKQTGADHSHRVCHGAFVDHYLELTFAGVVYVHFTPTHAHYYRSSSGNHFSYSQRYYVSTVKKAGSSNLSENYYQYSSSGSTCNTHLICKTHHLGNQTKSGRLLLQQHFQLYTV